MNSIISDALVKTYQKNLENIFKKARNILSKNGRKYIKYFCLTRDNVKQSYILTLSTKKGKVATEVPYCMMFKFDVEEYIEKLSKKYEIGGL